MKQTIIGAVPSKPNSYRIITVCGHGSLCKTPALNRYERDFYMQCGNYRGKMIDDLFELDIDVYVSSMSHDLDNTLKIVLDCLQHAGAIKNDNRCTRIVARKFIDKKNPHIIFELKEVDYGQKE